MFEIVDTKGPPGAEVISILYVHTHEPLAQVS